MFKHEDLIRAASKVAQSDGDYETAIPGLWVYRRSTPTEPMPCIYGLGLGITAQGSKRVLLSDEVIDYGVGQSLITSLDLPVVAQVRRASLSEPYIGIRLDLDARSIAEVAARMPSSKTNIAAATRAVSVAVLEEGEVDAMTRLISLLGEPHLIESLAPLIRQEIVVRLLNGTHGAVLRQLIAAGAPGEQFSHLMGWLKDHYTEVVSIDELAVMAHMSPSTFRQHFRTLTGTSPLQYLKQLRLQEAKQIMLNEDLDAAMAAMRVGYESASQFSREYSRLFGAPPYRDVQRTKKMQQSLVA